MSGLFARLSGGGAKAASSSSAAASSSASASPGGVDEDEAGSATTRGGKFGGTAASTMEMLQGGREVGPEVHCWTQCESSSFVTRCGPSYARNKQKAPSGPALMELVGLDLVRTPHRIDRIGSRLTIPPDFLSVKTTDPQQLVPSLFIVNAQVPSEFPSTFSFTPVTDGPGWSIVYYFRLTQATADAIADLASASPAVRLFVDYCRHAPELDGNKDSPWKGRFKAMYRSENIDQFGLPSFITSYNSKPVLINRTGLLSRGPGYIEMDINLHSFSAMAKKGLQVLIPYFSKMVVTAGFAIESHTDEEMPECLFGVATVIRANYKSAPDFC